MNLEESIGLEHPARVIWMLLGRFDLSRFEEPIASHEGESGRPCWPPRLLISVWVYGYQQGVGSARALEQRMNYEPGLRWLCAAGRINHHTLSDFRVKHQTALDDLLTQLLAVLEEEGLADFATVMQDGTKIRGVASKRSLHRRERVEEQLERARQYVQQVAAESEQDNEPRRQAARRRAAHDKQRRLEAALDELRQREAVGARNNKPPRVSTSEAEVRMMKQPDGGGWAPGYNLQLVTETRNRFVGGVTVSTAGNDQHQLQAGVAAVRQTTGRRPRRVVADSGYAHPGQREMERRTEDPVGGAVDRRSETTQRRR